MTTYISDPKVMQENSEKLKIQFLRTMIELRQHDLEYTDETDQTALALKVGFINGLEYALEKMSSSPENIFLSELNNLSKDKAWDYEIAHMKSDKIINGLLLGLGLHSIVNANNQIGKYYS